MQIFSEHCSVTAAPNVDGAYALNLVTSFEHATHMANVRSEIAIVAAMHKGSAAQIKFGDAPPLPF